MFRPLLTILAAASLWGAAPATLSRTRFPAKGRNEAILEVTRAGRYSLVPASKQGARIQIVDRMLGPAEADGTVGERDGRLDLLLDAGRYKVLVDSPEQGRGEVTLEVHPSTELHTPEPPLLVEHKPLRAGLEDFQQRSWWIHIPERRVVYLEGQGRNLADLRLWKDGAWLLDALPHTREAEPVKGRPERSCLLVADLNPGSYLLTAYGGPAMPWAKESGEHAFSLRYGIPVLPNTSRIDDRISAFGTDRYLVPSGANTYILQLAEKKSLRLDLASFAIGDIPGASEASATIDKKSADPECKVRHSTSKPYALVTVSGAPGEPYLFQCFDQQETYTFNAPQPADYRITTLHSGYVDDHIDATGILVSSAGGNPHVTATADDVIHIGGEKGWARRFNLLNENTLFFFVDQAGDYQIKSSGTPAQYRVEPFMVSRPYDYKTPGYEENGAVFSLDRGYWVLSINPKQKGILKVALQQKDYFTRLKDWVLGGDNLSPTSAKGSCVLPKVTLDPRYSYTLYLNRQDGVDHGVILRPLPLPFEEPVPLTLQPGKDESLPFIAKAESRLKIVALASAKYTCFIDGKPWSEGLPVTPGPHAVWIRNEGPKSLTFTLQGVPATQVADAPPQFLGLEEKKALDLRLPALTELTPVFFDLGKKEQRTALLSVGSPGLYRIETTGLLKTALTLRSAVRTKLFSAEANGVGRNALLSQYLKEGEYLLTAQTLDESAGHTGVRVQRTEVTKGGELVLDREAKAEVPANQGTLYTFTLPREGKYAIRTLGQNRFFPCRLEDAEGWPILAPATPSNLVQKLGPGSYRFMSLPLDVDSQRLTAVAVIPDQRRVEGKGPHTLALNEKLENLWREAAQGTERARDVYRVNLPADLDVTVTFGNDQMQGFLKKAGATESPIVVPPAKGWSGTLTAGDYLFEVECSRINDRVDYSLQIGTTQLAPGLKQELAVPGDIEVHLAKDAVVEIFSHGQMDVRGLLYRDGEPVDFSDDSFNDWNFRIARRLEAGSYLLKVESVGGQAGKSTIGMSAPAESVKEPLLAEADRTLDLEGAITVFPLQLKEDTDVFSVRITGAAQYGCILERSTPNGPVPLATQTGREIAIDMPVDKRAAYRLRLWSADHQSESVRLRTWSTTVPVVPAEKFATAQTLTASRFARIRIERGGTFAPVPVEGFSYSTSIDHPLEGTTNGLAAMPSGEAVIRWETGASAKLARVLLEKDLRIRIPQGTRQELDLKSSTAGPTVVMARGLSGKAACMALPGDVRPYLSGSYALSGDYAATVIPPSAPGRVLLWNPREEETPLSEMEVSSRAFPALPDAGTLTPGALQGTLAPGMGRQWNLPPGNKQLDLVLEDGLVAYLSEGGKVVTVAFAKGEATHTSCPTTATRLAVLSLSAQPAVYEFSLMDRTQTALPGPLVAGVPFERIFTQGGTLRFEISPGAEDRTLSVAGTSVTCEWMDALGRVRSGPSHGIREGGVATIAHGPGLVKVWTSAKGQEAEGRWGTLGSGPVVPLKPNSIAALDGTAREYALAIQKPSALHLRVECPAVVRLAGTITEGYPETSLDAFLMPGSYQLGIRALKGETLRGSAEFSLRSVIPIEKTFGPEGLIRGGESQVYSFTVKTKGSFGIGLKVDRDVLACQLLRADGTALGTGSQQFAELEPGTYLLRVSLPPGQEPTKYTPVVVGLEPPGNGPPVETLQAFLDGIGLLP